MVNELNMVRVQDILTLYRSGLSQQEVAEKLQVHRQTVARYVRLSNREAKSTEAPPGTESGEVSKSTHAPAGNSGQPSQCEPFRSLIEEKVRRQLTAQRIYQDLKFEDGFEASYYSVRRFVRKLEKANPLPFRRMECPPGQEAQSDFGKGAPVKRANGKRKCPHVLRIVLSFSRKAYSEALWHQDTESFLRGLENAFWSFGGVPRTVVLDNFKAAVLHPDWYDPVLNPKLQAFCEHYGTVILPIKAYTPRHQGKTERGIGYVKDNGLKDRQFDDLSGHNHYLAWWEANVADLRIHGTTRQQVKGLFETAEKQTLLPLPAGLFPFFHEGRRSVHRDGHVEVDKAYYSVPPEYLGGWVWVRYDSKLVRIFNPRMEQIALHSRTEPGKFQTASTHIPKEKVSGVERGTDYHLRRTRLIGPWSHQWAKTMLEERGIPGVRVLVGFVALTRYHSDLDLEKVCQIALRNGCFHLRPLRHLLKQPNIQPDLAFMETHPLIRDLAEYQAVVDRVFNQSQEKILFSSLSPSLNEDKDQIGLNDILSLLPSFYSGETNNEGHAAFDAETTAALGSGLQPGGPSAGSLGEPSEP